MKGLLVLFAIVAAAQARSTSVQNAGTALAALGDNPGLVHLRLSLFTSGFLKTCAGSLIGESWVLSSRSCLENARFIWVRYGVVTVINPELVTEASTVRLSPSDNVALVGLNRVIHSTANIAPVALQKSGDLPSSAKQCGFGVTAAGAPGEVLSCSDVTLTESAGSIITSGDIQATEFDDGVPLVSDGVQVAFLVGWTGSGSGEFLPVSGLVSWIEFETGLSL